MYQRIVTVQDISCLGQCSLTVALPILSVCGLETCVLPSAVLSTHTGGLGKPHIRDLSADMEEILQHWKQEKIVFDGILTGYLGNLCQISSVKMLFDRFLKENGKVVVDPAMADHGKLYQGIERAHVDAMRELCLQSQVVLPNMTEACLLTDLPYGSAEPEQAVEKLHKLGIPNVVLTGARENQKEVGVLISQNGNYRYYWHPKMPGNYHGTGDMFAAVFFGAWVQGKPLELAGKIAVDFTAGAIRRTFESPAHGYGVRFEESLPDLISMLR